jgi:hypothetical protein
MPAQSMPMISMPRIAVLRRSAINLGKRRMFKVMGPKTWDQGDAELSSPSCPAYDCGPLNLLHHHDFFG